jgi:hypothetical protein
MSPDRRAQELQKQIAKEAFRGRRKTDPKPIRWPDDKPFSFWPTLVGLVFGLMMIAAGIYFLRDHPELDKSPAQVVGVR